MIRAVAIDIDGTLTDERRRLDLEAVFKLRELEEMGIQAILATGNILCIAEAASIMIGTSGPLISENGGIVKDQRTGEVRYLGEKGDAEKAYRSLAAKYDVTKLQRSELRLTEVAIQRDISVEVVRKALKDFPVDVVDTKFAIHIKPRGMNKGRGLKEAAAIVGIDLEEIVAVGDSENDREMLEIAGYSISVGEKSLEDVCDYVVQEKYGKGGVEALARISDMVRAGR